MANALITGVAGLKSHQKMLEVIGNNLANLNTTGYKTRRTLFSDMLYETVRSASGSSSGNLGGINPAQVGSGSRVSQIDVQFGQGNLENTGELLDFAFQGNGFFVVDNGTQNLFTRGGAFSVDDSGTLIDPATGYRVQRIGTIGEPDGVNPAFQTAGDTSILIPFGATIPGQETSTIDLTGNLPSFASGPVSQIVASFTPWNTGGAAAVPGTTLNSLDLNTGAYAAGDSIDITGVDHDGTAVSTSVAVDATTTMAGLVSAIDAAFSGATAVLEADGRISLTSGTVGASQLSLTLSDAAGNAGSTDFAGNSPIVSTTGQDGATFQSAVEVFDGRGESFTVSMNFEKQADGSWNLTAGLDPADGTVIDGSVDQIRFGDDGSFLQVDGTGVGDANLIIDFPSSSTPQTIQLSFGTAGEFDGLTELATEPALAAQQNGFPPGALVSIQVRGDGVIEGISSTGRTIPIAQLAIASFRNPDGLLAQGDNYYDVSLASGDVQLGTALSGDRGSIRSGQLEASNVDIALEFTRLIIAQRGFSANARTITVTDEILEELTNLIR